MYLYEDRLRAVALYIKLGKCATLTICQLGYPSKNALKSWCRDYQTRACYGGDEGRLHRHTQTTVVSTEGA